jgi:hypothetical protein
MAYIGNEPTSVAFVTDLFSGNASTTAFTMSVAPANTASILVAVSGVVQSPDTYSISGTTLTFSAAPPAGAGNISVRYLGVPASNVTTTAYRTVTEFTATAGQTTFSVPSYTVGYIDVYRNGVRLGTADYTATSGTSVVLVNAATLGDLVSTESFYVSSVLNAIPATGGAINTIYLDAGNANGTGALLTPSGTTAQRPASPIVGMQRWNTTIGGMEVYIGSGATGWQTIASTAYSIDYLIAAAGGAGGGDIGQNIGLGGGGGGGVISGSSLSVSPGTSYTITIGAGGAGGTSTASTSGSDSSAFTFSAIGGGRGSGQTSSSVGYSASSGGSGGGGQGWGASSTPGSLTGASGTVGQGFAGGNGLNPSPYPAGGGGGAGGVGGTASSIIAGSGGIGFLSTISGSSTYYAGGGGGGVLSANSASAGSGGSGGGGAGALGTAGVSNGTNGGTNTGGGGGGSSSSSVGPSFGGNGGSGVVIIRYLGTVQRATGGTVTITGGYVIHTFTSSGTYIA